MDFATVGKVALELGVIPTVALFLVVSMHLQNKRLTSMLEKHEQSTFEILKELVAQISDYRSQNSGGGRK